MGIECAYVLGQCKSGEYHAWNLIKLEGDYYYLDCTWGDSTNTDQTKNGSANVNYNYFCITTEELLRSRTVDEDLNVPQCTAKKCNYHVRSGYYFTSYQVEKINQIIEHAINRGEKNVSFKFASSSLSGLCKKRLIDDGAIWDIFRKTEKEISKYHYNVNEELYVIMIYW